MSRLPIEFLRHILLEADLLLKWGNEISEEEFMRDEKTKRAFARSFEIIGEAAKSIPEEFKRRYPQAHWKTMGRMRDKLIHHYFGVNYGVVWDTVRDDLPLLKTQIQEIVEAERGFGGAA